MFLSIVDVMRLEVPLLREIDNFAVSMYDKLSIILHKSELLC